MTAIVRSPIVMHATLHSIPDAVISFSIFFRSAPSVGMIGLRMRAHSIIVVKAMSRIVLKSDLAVVVLVVIRAGFALEPLTRDAAV